MSPGRGERSHELRDALLLFVTAAPREQRLAHEPDDERIEHEVDAAADADEVREAAGHRAHDPDRAGVALAHQHEPEILQSLGYPLGQRIELSFVPQSMAVSRDSVMECTVFDDADIEGWQPGGDYTGRLLPPLVSTQDERLRGLQILEEVL